ncbi:MAG: ROK family protein [Microthrixaceae bacterium]
MLAVGIDVGGTKVLGVRLERVGGRVRVAERIHLPVARGHADSSDGVAAQVADVAAVLSVDTPGIPIGVGLAGFVGTDGVAARSPNVPQVVGVDLGAALHERLGVRPLVDNDANCVATAALALRTPRVSDLVAVTFGTGIGGGLVAGGELLRGSRGFAGEPGHMVVVRDGIPCVCGQSGCWERYASGARLSELATEAFAGGRVAGPDADRSGRSIGSRSARPGELLVEAARAGDAGALEVLAEFSGWLAVGLSNLVNLLDPELLVVGGGLSSALDVLSEPLTGHLASNPTISDRVPPLEAAPMAEASGAVGAALMAMRGAGTDPRPDPTARPGQ